MKLASSNANHALSPWPHRAAMVLASCVFPLIWVGGLVTTYDAGMAVEDWPGTFGHNLFLFPWDVWLAAPCNLFIEHGHRLLGALAGLLTILFLLMVFRFDQRRHIRGLAILALVLVCAQGLLGGQRVLLNARWIALVHGCVGPFFFAFCCCLATLTSARWMEMNSPTLSNRVLRSVSVGLGLAYLQLILGAMLRHPNDDTSPLWFRQVLWFHMFLGLALVGHLIGLFFATRAKRGVEPWISAPATRLALLAMLQIGLGFASLIVKYGWPVWLGSAWFAPNYTVEAKNFWSAMIVTGHVANGSLILAQLAVLCVRCFRSVNWSEQRQADHSFKAMGVAL